MRFATCCGIAGNWSAGSRIRARKWAYEAGKVPINAKCCEYLGHLREFLRKEDLMKQVLVALLAVVLCAPATIRASQDDVSAPVRQFIDGFNTGNVQAASQHTQPALSRSSTSSHPTSGPGLTPSTNGRTLTISTHKPRA